MGPLHEEPFSIENDYWDTDRRTRRENKFLGFLPDKVKWYLAAFGVWILMSSPWVILTWVLS